MTTGVYPRVCGGTLDVSEITVYPRVCGGTLEWTANPDVGSGLSPRVRGHQTKLCIVIDAPGSIPACAGAP